MAESTRLVDLVQRELDRFLADHHDRLQAISPDLDPFIEFSRALLSGGKRFRALFCYWGWQAVTGYDEFDPLAEPSEHPDLNTAVKASAALELFHAAALVHDDIMDNSDTRRGMPSAHRRFESLHAGAEWQGNGRHFGQSGALLLGDLLLGWSDELLDDGLRSLRSSDAAHSARAEFTRMRAEVTAGQYLDMLEEVSWRHGDDADSLERTRRVIVYKSAKYTVEAPLAIGGSLGGASLAQFAALRDFGLPLGVAYQLRDDVLGVFGDEHITGKPSGDDLREGKHTTLIAIARRRLPSPARRLLDELLGDPSLDQHQIEMLQTTIRDSGALADVEHLIADHVSEAVAALDGAPLSTAATREFRRLADSVASRES
ncbi:polyprenyl synthetase family protein [Ruicaihuangia caeni]|uniref:Polyprenyl synthetase family protein n=1 Tax=Ruicaihuangia caeni TaxID=3042517 RepID=A0AAW6T8Z9_9MICO|nr:polyprenyl synthetase family protein [Klugiella sp. YN-L-19]MDI2098253.1 polyprenyl synthetase family protein [Klugiella sp. YN-L-19]